MCVGQSFLLQTSLSDDSIGIFCCMGCNQSSSCLWRQGMMDVTVYRRFCQVIWLQFTSTSLIQCIKLCTSLVLNGYYCPRWAVLLFPYQLFFQGKQWEGRSLLKTFSLGCHIEILNSKCASESPTGLQNIQTPRLHPRLSKLLIENLEVGDRDI